MKAGFKLASIRAELLSSYLSSNLNISAAGLVEVQQFLCVL